MSVLSKYWLTVRQLIVKRKQLWNQEDADARHRMIESIIFCMDVERSPAGPPNLNASSTAIDMYLEVVRGLFGTVSSDLFFCRLPAGLRDLVYNKMCGLYRRCSGEKRL